MLASHANTPQSLWSINDRFASSTLIYVVIIVAMSTYIVVFNMNSLIHSFSRLYEAKKKRVIRAMHLDLDETWQKRGQKFEAFRPKHENPQPSEWYVLLYALLKPAVVLGFRHKSSNMVSPPGAESQAATSTGFFKFANHFSKRRHKPKDSWREDEGWIIGDQTST